MELAIYKRQSTRVHARTHTQAGRGSIHHC